MRELEYSSGRPLQSEAIRQESYGMDSRRGRGNRKMRTDSKSVFERGFTRLADNLDKCVDRTGKIDPDLTGALE